MSKYIRADSIEKAIRKRVYAIEVEDILAEIANAPTIKTKTVKYFDEDESVWKIGEVIIDDEDIQGGTE